MVVFNVCIRLGCKVGCDLFEGFVSYSVKMYFAVLADSFVGRNT